MKANQRLARKLIGEAACIEWDIPLDAVLTKSAAMVTYSDDKFTGSMLSFSEEHKIWFMTTKDGTVYASRDNDPNGFYDFVGQTTPLAEQKWQIVTG